MYFHHGMVIPQMGSGFSSVLLVDSSVWHQKPSNIRAIYYLSRIDLARLPAWTGSGKARGKLAEGSDKSVPIIGNQAESSDKPETMELIAPLKRTVLRQEMKICNTSFLLKSTLLFSNKSDCGNHVRTFTHEKFG